MCLFPHTEGCAILNGTQPWKMSFVAPHLNIMCNVTYCRCLWQGFHKSIVSQFCSCIATFVLLCKGWLPSEKVAHAFSCASSSVSVYTEMHGDTQGTELSFPTHCSRCGNRLMSCHSGLEAWKREAAAWFSTKRVTNAHIHTELHTLPWLSSCSDHMTTWLGPHPVSQPLTAASHLCEESWLFHADTHTHTLPQLRASSPALAFHPLFGLALSFFI